MVKTAIQEKKTDSTDTKVPMWLYFMVSLKILGPLGGSIPRTKEEILAMLEARKPSSKPAGAIPIEVLAEQVAGEVGIPQEPEENIDDVYAPGWVTFKKDAKGLYVEGRTIRGHLKDCALQVQNFFPNVKNFRSKVVNRLYVLSDKIQLGKSIPDGTEHRFVQVITRLGPRSGEKYIDYVDNPLLIFTLSLLNDGVITLEHINALFEYGQVHGLGQERSQGWGRYKVESITSVQKP